MGLAIDSVSSYASRRGSILLVAGAVLALGLLCVAPTPARAAAVDACANIAGAQAAVPDGMALEGDGACRPVAASASSGVDLCLNIPGEQSSLPVTMVIGAQGACVVPGQEDETGVVPIPDVNTEPLAVAVAGAAARPGEGLPVTGAELRVLAAGGILLLLLGCSLQLLAGRALRAPRRVRA